MHYNTPIKAIFTRIMVPNHSLTTPNIKITYTKLIKTPDNFPFAGKNRAY